MALTSHTHNGQQYYQNHGFRVQVREVLKFAAYIGTPDSERSKSNTLAEALAKLPGNHETGPDLLALMDDDTPPPPNHAGTVIPISQQRKS